MLKSKKEQSISYYLFLVLRYLEEKGEAIFDIRKFADDLGVSWKVIEAEMENARGRGMIEEKNDNGEETVLITSSGLEALEPYRVKNAVILAAGFGSRLMPATENCPKPLVKVNGVRLIDTLLDALIGKGIDNITVVRGYKKEAWSEIVTKYPFINFVDNLNYENRSNTLSVIVGLEKVKGGTCVCDGDFYLTNPDIIKKYHYYTSVLGSYCLQTDDWCFMCDNNGVITDYGKGGSYCWNRYGLDFFPAYLVDTLKNDLAEYWIKNKDDAGSDFENCTYVEKRDVYCTHVIPCRKTDIIEIDNYFELKKFDKSYK